MILPMPNRLSAHSEALHLRGTVPDPHSMPVIALVLSAIGTMGFSLFAWAVLTLLEAMGGYSPEPGALLFVPLLPLPAALVGAVASWRTKRYWPFYAGLAVSLLPIALAFLLPPLFDPGLGGGGMD